MLRKLSSEGDPADWFYLASDRLKTADLAWKVEGLTASGIELLQESVERYLKGYLISKGWKLMRTHDLSALVSEAISYDSRFKDFISLADELTRDFFAQHYPGGDWQTIGQHYPDLRRQTGDMVELIRQSLPQHFPTSPP